MIGSECPLFSLKPVNSDRRHTQRVWLNRQNKIESCVGLDNNLTLRHRPLVNTGSGRALYGNDEFDSYGDGVIPTQYDCAMIVILGKANVVASAKA